MLATDLELRQYVGTSNGFIKSLKQHCTPDSDTVGHTLPEEETLLLASCNYEIGTEWGKEVCIFYDPMSKHIFLINLSNILNALLFLVYATRLDSCMVQYVKMFTLDSH